MPEAPSETPGSSRRPPRCCEAKRYLLRQVYTDYTWENFTLRLATRDQHSVSLHILRDQNAPRTFIDPDWAALSPSERADRLSKNVRHTDQGDIYLENIPMFQQGHTPFCGIHSLAMVFRRGTGHTCFLPRRRVGYAGDVVVALPFMESHPNSI